MSNRWLLEVLSDIGDYAEKNDLPWLVPLMDQAYKAARKELSPRTPAPMNWREVTKGTSTDSQEPRLIEPATLLNFPSRVPNSASAHMKGTAIPPESKGLHK